ncbi:glutaminyl-peptide cyclotransferase [Aequorivita lipolytica]|uniref:Glutaminyl-peptide cyclotransferase n=1 Tax=Aequorivita lipolytica TaxID=153267 RepID=A0A5C6YLC9_9FLAO|nr:glutaminyl-peptide cyclotransferase [Aequorivita lipolytica]TXD68069.1 glutaminyl-peptide cyclotransferase [Aequorivita lipolytica]SRX53618.1 hypothetical protein AEQU2_02850 [Aequorivita lipolytica]
MKIYNVLVPTLLLLFLGSCGNNSEEKKDAFSLEIKDSKKTYTTEDVLTISLTNKKNIETDSIIYFLNKDRVEVSGNTLSLSGKKLGEKILTAKIYSDNEEYEASQKVTILSSIKPKLYTYKVLETYPHDINAYTQGLEFENDTLYESTGQYKESSLRKTDYKTGEVLQKVTLADQYFAEGLTILNNKIYQLTWRENMGFIYNLKTMEQTGTFVYGQSKEGWGLCHDAENNIYKSDGTDKIWTLNSNTLAEKDYIEIFTNTSKINSVNELEWVEGKIYANVYQQGSIAIINPSNGAVEGVIDLTDLKDKVTQHPKLDVLNGIAYNGEPNILYITGKNWDKLFKVEIIQK